MIFWVFTIGLAVLCAAVLGRKLYQRSALRGRLRDPNTDWASLTSGAIDAPRVGELRSAFVMGTPGSGHAKVSDQSILIAYDDQTMGLMLPGTLRDSWIRYDRSESTGLRIEQSRWGPALVEPDWGLRVMNQRWDGDGLAADLHGAGWL